jgi:hypothetical protein
MQINVALKDVGCDLDRVLARDGVVVLRDGREKAGSFVIEAGFGETGLGVKHSHRARARRRDLGGIRMVKVAS